MYSSPDGSGSLLKVRGSFSLLELATLEANEGLEKQLELNKLKRTAGHSFKWIDMITQLLDLFFPLTCYGCKLPLKKTEQHICYKCRFTMAETKHISNERNELMQKFYGRLPLEFAASLYFFQKNNPIQEIIHELKYRNKQVVGELFAKQFANELIKIQDKQKFDYIVPVPLHKRKLKKRGYNQLDSFGRYLANKFDIKYVPDMVIKTINTKTQTIKSLDERSKVNVLLFKRNEVYEFRNKHILLIDDVVTTGTTIEACGKAIVVNEDCRLSLLTMSYTI